MQSHFQLTNEQIPVNGSKNCDGKLFGFGWLFFLINLYSSIQLASISNVELKVPEDAAPHNGCLV